MNETPLVATLRENKKDAIIPTMQDFQDMKAIIELLEPFREVGDDLGGEKDVTISKILPVFDYLRTTWEVSTRDNHIVRQMKPVMLAKLNSRYNAEQTKFLTICSLLDVHSAAFLC